MRYRVPLLLCALLLCAVGLGVHPVAADPQPGETHLDVQLEDDGDAEWSVTVAVAIGDDGEREEFETFATGFEAGSDEIGFGLSAFERAADEAAAETDRDMRIRSVRRETEVVEEPEDSTLEARGLLRITFVWESFARVEADDTLVVVDAFNTSDGTWLPGLTADQSLIIRSPPGYGGPTTSPIGADAGDLRWDGPQTFEPGYFNVVYPPSGGPGSNVGLSTVLVGGALLLSAAALLLGLYLLIAGRRSGTVDSDDRNEDASTAADPEPASPPDTPDRSDGADGTASDVDPGPPEEGQAAEESTDSPEKDLELLSDEERVEYLLERNGGRMKQATIVKETGWSNAKVSQLLSAMDEADRVDKLRIGRENLISLPGEGVGDLRQESDGS